MRKLRVFVTVFIELLHTMVLALRQRPSKIKYQVLAVIAGN